jgi:hypothetical protein
LLFQPAEETGFGAQAVIDDQRSAQIMHLLSITCPVALWERLACVQDLPIVRLEVCKFYYMVRVHMQLCQKMAFRPALQLPI